MNNGELLIALQDMFENKVEEVKRHTGSLLEDMRGDIKAIAEGHSLLNDKMDRLEIKVDRLETKVDRLDSRVYRLEVKVDNIEKRLDVVENDVKYVKSDMTIVKDYIIGVDAKLNEHEIILKRVK